MIGKWEEFHSRDLPSCQRVRMSKRNELSLQDRIRVIEYAEEHPKEGSRALSIKFNCGKTQILTILKEVPACVMVCVRVCVACSV